MKRQLLIQTFLLGVLIVSLSSSTLQKRLNVPFEYNRIESPSVPDFLVDITDFGAQANDTIRDDEALANALQLCKEKGGGTVVIKGGLFYTGPIELTSNICLRIEKGSELKFSNNKKDYLPAVFTRWEGIECYNYRPMIYVKDAQNVILTGEGRITGNGEKWWKDASRQIETLTELYDRVMDGVPVSKRIMASEDKESFLRPALIQFINCKNIEVSNLSITSGPMWTNHFIYCENLLVKGLDVKTEGRNNDGVIPDACKNVWINNCTFNTGDDCIVIKSGLNEDGWRVGKASENIVISNCKGFGGHGGIAIGSEMSGGVKNVYVTNCSFQDVETGIRIKSMKGRGGYVRNVFLENIDFENIKLDAIKVSMNYKSSSIPPRSDSMPVFEGISLKNIKCRKAGFAITMRGYKAQYIKDVSFEDLDINATVGVYASNIENITLNNVKVKVEKSNPWIGENIRELTSENLVINSKDGTAIKFIGDVEQVFINGEKYSSSDI